METIIADTLLKAHIKAVSITPITDGASGAEICDINGEYILKLARDDGKRSELFESFIREFRIYKENAASGLLPEIVYSEMTDDGSAQNLCALLMRKYQPLHPRDYNNALRKEIAKTLAYIHSSDLIKLNACGESVNAPEAAEIVKWHKSWAALLDEYGDKFGNRGELDALAVDYPLIAAVKMGSIPIAVSHGDFHIQNILRDGESLRVCDWQNAGVRHINGDIAFFLNRLTADIGYDDTDAFLRNYMDSYTALNGKSLDEALLRFHIARDTLGVSFAYWHEYLHGAEYERVKTIYDKMISSYKICKYNLKKIQTD